MPDRLVQITERVLSDERVERGAKPVFETHLQPNQTLIGTGHAWDSDYGRRKTVDHHLVVYVATDTGATDA